MPPKGRGRDTQQPKGRQRGAASEDNQDTIHFGLPQQVSAALQAISARSTAGLFKDAVTIPADQTAQQIAQARANQLDRINKRLAGNTKAKIALQDAANSWLGKYGQHLVALADRLNNIATTLDRDQSAAVTLLQEATAALAVDPTEQVQSALASMGPIWSSAQEAEVLRLAASLRAFSAVGSGDSVQHGTLGPQSTSLGSLATAAGAGSAMPVGPMWEPQLGAFGSASSTPERAGSSGDGVALSPMDTSGADTAAKRRWNQRGNRHPRPSKSPRRELDLSAEPWPKAATGLTPERPSRVAGLDDEELIPAVSTTQLTWTTAWFRISRQCWEQGSAVVGQLALSECQEQALPLQHLTSDPAAAIAEGEALWTLLGQVVQQLESDSEVLQLVERLRVWLGACRECPAAVPQVRQGLLLLAHATQGHLCSIDAAGPSTAQEWLYPAELLGQDIPLTGVLSATWDSLALRVLSTMPCPLREVPDEPDL